jgi:phosphoribosyl-AMP cyclohydrolase
MPQDDEANAALTDEDDTIEETGRFTPRFDASGLMPCIAVDHQSGAVLMLAWINAEALEATLSSGFAHYWSRSRGSLWKKGETSGALQRIVEIRTGRHLPYRPADLLLPGGAAWARRSGPTVDFRRRR